MAANNYSCIVCIFLKINWIIFNNCVHLTCGSKVNPEMRLPPVSPVSPEKLLQLPMLTEMLGVALVVGTEAGSPVSQVKETGLSGTTTSFCTARTLKGLRRACFLKSGFVV